MSDNVLPRNSLVLYKNRPARITEVGKKIEIETENGRLSVRPKDVTLLHRGPLSSLAQLTPCRGAVQTAWELLAGDTVTLADLSDLIYDAFTPQTAWALWQLVDDGLYFSGAPELIQVHTAEQVAMTKAARAAKAAEQEAWGAFLARINAGSYLPEDAPYLNEIAALAMGRQERSKVLRALHEKEEPEQAHD